MRAPSVHQAPAPSRHDPLDDPPVFSPLAAASILLAAGIWQSDRTLSEIERTLGEAQVRMLWARCLRCQIGGWVS